MKRLVLVFTLLTSVATAQEVSIPFAQVFDAPGIDGTLVVSDVTRAEDGRCHIAVAARAPSLWPQVDALGRGEGNLGSNTHRLFWVGPTQMREVRNNTVTLTSRARYELWGEIDVLFDTIKTKILQDTKNVDLRLSAEWSDNTLSLSYEITNIRNFPGEVEGWLRDLGVAFGETEQISLPQDDTIADLTPRFETGPTLAAHQNGLEASGVVSLTLPGNWFYDTCIILQDALASDDPYRIEAIQQIISEI